MPLSFNPTEFSQRYGIFCFPILADLTVYSLFSRATTAAKAQIASLVVGMGIAYALADRTSLITNLIGAGLYLAYKVALYFYAPSAPTEVAKPVIVNLVETMRDLEQAYEQLEHQFLVVSDEYLSYDSLTFNNRLQEWLKNLSIFHQSLQNEIQDAKQKRAAQPEFVEVKTLHILKTCQAILFHIHQELEKEMQQNRYAMMDRSSQMVTLLQNPHLNPDHTFGKALLILGRTFRSFQKNGYLLKLTRLRHSSDVQTFRIFEDRTCVFTTSRQKEILKVFEETTQQLNHLIIAVSIKHARHHDVNLLSHEYITTPIIPNLPISVAAEQLGL